MEKQSKLIKFVEGDWSKVFIIAITVFGLFAWNRSESRADYRELRSFTETNLAAIHQEIKDFHGKLCALEEKYHQMERK